MNNSVLLASYLVNAVWQITLIAVAGCLLARLLRVFSSRAEHILCVFTLVSAMLLPATPLLRAIFIVPFHSPAASVFLLFVPAASPDNGINAGRAFILSTAAISVLAFLYVASFCYFAAKLLWSLRCAAKLLQSASPLALSPAQEQVLSKCLQAFSMKAPLILSSVRVSGPVVLGLRRSILLVPPDFATNCAPSEFLAALAHEFAHIERHDFMKNLLYEAISLIADFHPAIWILKSQIAQSREMICDRIVTERVVAPVAYARSLLSLASMVATVSQAASTAHPIGMFDANILERRIMMLKSKNRHVNPLVRYGLTIVATLFVLAVSLATSKASIAVETSQTSSQIVAVSAGATGPVYKVGKDVSAPIPIKTPNAEFPEAAKRAKEPINAIVVVGLVVDADGMPRQLRIARSFRADFDAEALKAVERYRFSPGKRAGKPVATAVNIEVHFKWY
jgi:TonB family protein